MRVETLTPVVAAAPGARARWRVRIENDDRVATGYRLRVIGFDAADVLLPPPTPPLEPGASLELDVELLVPDAFAAGHHSIAIEVVPDRPGIEPVIAGVTVTVGTIDDFAVAIVPSTIRARRRATFRVDIDNRSNEARELELEGDSAELEIQMRPERLVLGPGERVRTSGRIKGPRHLVGEPRQHSLTVAARSRSAPAYAAATFQQRAVFPRGLRTMLGVLLIVTIWGGAIGAGFLWWQSRTAEPEAAPELVDVDGDGIDETAADELVDTDGDGIGDTFAKVIADEVAANGREGSPQPGGSDVPTRTSMGGTVAAPEGGQAEGVDVTLTPIDVGAPPPVGATVLGFRDGELRELDGPPTAAKFWPARFGRYEPDIRSGYRRTQSVPDTTATNERGVWFFGSVSVGQSYEVTFSRPGYDTQAFVITPSADGKPIDLPVEMEPAKGEVRGRVIGSQGGLGNVELVLTDGTLVFNSASASEGDVGSFAFTGVSTPGTYTLKATAPGLGTEILQVTLEAGEQRAGVDIRMSTGVGSISGRVTEGGRPLGGVTLTASNGDTTVETTSLTEGAAGTYLFPRLEIPGRWTIEAELDGYVTQTRLVELNGNATGVDFAFLKRTGSIIGLVESTNGGPLPGVNIRVSRDDLVFESQTAVAPDPGSFNIRDLPPGTYLVELTRFDHEPTSQTVTIGPGQVADLGTITMVFRPRPDIPQNGGLQVSIVDSEGNPIIASRTAPGVTVRVLRVADDTVVGEQVGAADQSSFVFQPLLIGTYRIEVTRGLTYRRSTRTVSVGLTVLPVVIPIYLLGQVSGRLIDSFTREELVDYDVRILRINTDGSEVTVQNLPVRLSTPLKEMPDGTLQRRFETANPPGLTSGRYRVDIDNAPPGYLIRPDQVLQPGQPPMQFVIRPDNDLPLDLGSILADRFPEIHGVVEVPRLDAAPTPGAPRPISFVPIDDDTLGLTLTCASADPTDPTDPDPRIVLPEPPGLIRPYIGSELRDEVGPNTAVESFYISPIDLEELNLIGACQLEVRAAGYTTKTIDVFVDPIRGQHSRIDRNVGLVRPRDIAGRAFWVDDGPTATPEVNATGVTVRLQGPATTGFDPGTVPFGSTGDDPQPVSEPIASVVTAADGSWVFFQESPPVNADLPYQVFAEAVYAFEAPGRFQSRTIRMTVDENGKSAVGVFPDPPPFPLEVAPTGDRVQLDANGADITARLDIRTVKGSGGGLPAVSLAGFSAALSGANAVTRTPVISGGNSLGSRVQATTVGFGVTPDPGTHQWTVTAPTTPGGERPLFKPATPADAAISPPFFQDVATALSPANQPALVKTYVEMGAMNVQVVDPGGRPITGAQVSLSSSLLTVPLTIGAGTDNIVAGLDVPLGPGGSIPYTVSLTQADNPRLHVSTARVTLVNDTPGLFIGPSGCALGGGCGTVTVYQGARPTIRITVSRYGTFTGTVCGTTSDTRPFPDCEVLEVDGTPPLTVTATLIAVRTSPFDPSLCADESGLTVTAVASATGSFQFFGPPGYYRVTVGHPDHETITGEFITQEGQDLECQNPDIPQPFPLPPLPGGARFGGQPVYQLRDDQDRVLTDPWYLLRLRSNLTVNVFDDTLLPTPGAATADASVTIISVGGTNPVARCSLATPCVTPASGQISLAGSEALLPGTYEVSVSKTDYFPLTVRIEIRRGGGPVTVNVPLPRVGGSIIGDIVARNSEGDLVQVPTAATVAATYDQPDPAVTGATVVSTNAAPTPPAPTYSTVTRPDGDVRRYSIGGLGSGVHQLSYTLDNSAGIYTDVPPATVPVTVLSPGVTTAPEAVYRAANRTVVVQVTSARDITGATVTLIDPDGGGTPTPDSPRVVGPCAGDDPPISTTQLCARFDGVPPELAQYRVVVQKPLFATASVPFTVVPGASDVVVTVPLPLAGNTARVIGVARQVEDEATVPTVNFVPTGTTIRLINTATGTVAQTTVTSGAGSFQFDITVPGTYGIEALVTGYATRRTTVTITADDLGTTLPSVTVNVEKFAAFTVTVSGTGLDLSTVAGVALITGPGAPAAPQAMTSAGGGVFTYANDPAWSYRFRFTSTQGYAAVTAPPGADPPSEPAIGAEVPLTATMAPRSISGTVTGGDGGTVRLVSGPSTVVAGPASIDTDGTYTIPGPIPAGAYTLVAELTGTGRGTLPVTVALADGNLTGQNITLTARTVTIGFTKTPAGATVTITPATGAAITGTGSSFDVLENRFPISYVVSSPGFISSAPVSRAITTVNQAATDRWNAATLTMTAAAVTLSARTISGTVSGSSAAGATVRAVGSGGAVVGPVATSAGAYTLSGPFPPDTYSVVAEELGRGRAVAGATIADDTSASPTGVDLSLAARNVNLSFASSPTGASILVGGTTVGTAGGTAVARLENAFPFTFVARLDGYLDSVATTVNLAPNEAASPTRWNLGTLTQSVPSVTLTPRTVTGTVTGGTTSTSVRAIRGATTVGPVPATGTGTYTLSGLGPGTWTIVAEQLGVGRGTTSVTIADGDGNSTAPSITLAARTVTVTFSVTAPPPTANVNVTLVNPAGTATGTTGSPGIDILENRFGISYTLSATGFLTSASQSLAITAVNEPAATRWNSTALTMTAPTVTLVAGP